ncbi:hypothetical protein JTE90_001413 [Oedothorax gibbosus]|uniref:Uncharacterized protein n=1 Tax=Oedothorax gibbosus TaxID=931172 RepID=A0AAV6VIF6_9ARAC|nr:hypothetical protein JTE90_001413 [Oedothorax gibbosus]
MTHLNTHDDPDNKPHSTVKKHSARKNEVTITITINGNKKKIFWALASTTWLPPFEKVRFILIHLRELRHLDDKPVTTLERFNCGGKQEDPTYLDDIQNFILDCKTTLIDKFHRRFNAIV